MMRRYAWLLLIAGAVFTNLASAVGLGEIKLNSALNQPLNAEIKLLNTGDLSKNELLPNLASHEDFARAGVERVFFLTGLKFDIKFKSDGDVIINMTSDKIVREPFLNFLVEIHWPNGRILREYTLLLDPPLFAEAPPAPIRQAAVATTPNRAQPRPAPAPRSTPSTTRGGDKVVIKKNDTLWGIARDNRPDSDLSIRQTMLAIQRENPHAFINDNINLIRAGQVLRVPSASEIRSVSSGEAFAEARRQNQEWREKQAVASASEDDEYAAAPATEVPEDDGGMLKLVGDDFAEEGDATASTASGAAAEGGDSVTGESGYGLSGSSDAADPVSDPAIATAKVGELESQLDDLKRLLTLKDQQLALLQASAANDPGATEDVAGVQDGATDAADSEVSPPASSAAAEEKGLLDMVTENPIYIGIAILIFLAILVVMGALSRRKSEQDDYPVGLQNAIAEAETEVEFSDEFIDELDDDLAGLDAGEESAYDEDVVAATTSSEGEAEAEAVRKVLEEAEIYIAYGRSERALEILQPATDEYPENPQLVLKMAEICIALDDAGGLTRQEAKLQDIGDSDAIQQLQALKRNTQQAADAERLAEETGEEFDAGDDIEDDILAGADALDELDISPEQEPANRDNVVDFDSAAASKQEAKIEPLEFSLDDLSGDVDISSEADGAAEEQIDEDEIEVVDHSGESGEDDFLGDTDESATKLELARAYIDMADQDAAEDILNEVIEEGSDDQKQTARQLLEGLG